MPLGRHSAIRGAPGDCSCRSFAPYISKARTSAKRGWSIFLSALSKPRADCGYESSPSMTHASEAAVSPLSCTSRCEGVSSSSLSVKQS